MSITMTKNRIEELFEQKKERILSVYFTAGFPAIDDTAHIVEHLAKAGADIVEVGIPYSDPVADGPTIQESNKVALDNGISLQLIFDQLGDIRKSVDIPIILMGYINPVLQYGIEAFCKKCAEIGIDGVILPDLPMQEYLEGYKNVFEAHGLLNIFLITPQTSDARVREIDGNSRGFIYMVSSASTTGAKAGISSSQLAYFERIKAMKLNNPTLIGFGISDKATFDQASAHASGAIIGSAFIQLLSNTKNMEQDIFGFIQSVKGKA
ncbi:MAG: tryptophan synthase subunit alpha [Cyclobacteriaceae bacterium]|nr:tryptophan synthase subunit alpha [Cyclobacteriaceae bacterium]